MALFNRHSATDALSTFLRTSEEGGATDSRSQQSKQLLAAGVSLIVWDGILDGFVSDPAIFAAAMSNIACASVASSKLEELTGVRSIKALRQLAREVDGSIIITKSEALEAYLKEASACGRDGKVWLLLVAAHLSALRANADLRPLIYPHRTSETS
jgi:hypothetical protein